MSRIAAALNTSDLSHGHVDREPGIVHADVVRVLGLTAIHRSLGVLVIEAKRACAGESPHDVARIKDLTEAVRRIVQRQAERDNITIRFREVSEFIVRELILSFCPRCQGRGYLPLAYGPDTFADGKGADCPTCLGSGRARRDFKGRAKAAGYPDYSEALKRFWEAVECRIVDAENAAEWAKWKKLPIPDEPPE